MYKFYAILRVICGLRVSNLSFFVSLEPPARRTPLICGTMEHLIWFTTEASFYTTGCCILIVSLFLGSYIGTMEHLISWFN